MPTNDDLVRIVETNGDYLQFKSPRDPQVLEALRRVDRREFLPDVESQMPLWIYDREFLARVGIPLEMYGKSPIPSRLIAYADVPLQIGFNQTCSAPSMIALMADVLELGEGMNVLEVGTGCGYHAAVTGELIGSQGRLVTMEYLLELAELGRGNLQHHFADSRVSVVHRDGSLGYESEAPFDRIYFTAGVDQEKSTFDPMPLLQQLSPGGVLLIPNHQGPMIKIRLNGTEPKIERIGYFGFVPLQGGNT